MRPVCHPPPIPTPFFIVLFFHVSYSPLLPPTLGSTAHICYQSSLQVDGTSFVSTQPFDYYLFSVSASLSLVVSSIVATYRFELPTHSTCFVVEPLPMLFSHLTSNDLADNAICLFPIVKFTLKHPGLTPRSCPSVLLDRRVVHSHLFACIDCHVGPPFSRLVYQT